MTAAPALEPRVPASKLAGTLPADWQKGTFVGRVMLPEGPAVVRLEKDGTLTDITGAFPTMSDLCNTDDPAAAAWAAKGKSIGKFEDILNNTPTRANDKQARLLTPIDYQTVKAAGVTFADSLIERAVEEATGHMPQDPIREKGDTGIGPKQLEQDRIRAELKSKLPEHLSKIIPGSKEALEVLDYITRPVVPAKPKPGEAPKEPGLGLSKHYFAVGLGKIGEIFTKADTLAAVGTGVGAGFLDQKEYGMSNPEPELVLVTSAKKNGTGGRIVGAAVGNDINHGDIEGISALLLGECKNQNGTCVVGPFIRLLDKSFTIEDAKKANIDLHIENADGKKVFSGTNSMSEISRDPEKMVDQMYANNKGYADGAVLFCGTTCVPKIREDDGSKFTHRKGDTVTISSEKLGSISNVMRHCTEIEQPEFGILELAKNLAERGVLLAKKTWRAVAGGSKPMEAHLL